MVGVFDQMIELVNLEVLVFLVGLVYQENLGIQLVRLVFGMMVLQGYLVCLVYLVYLAFLVDLGCLGNRNKMAVKDKLVELGMLVVGLVFDKLAWPVILEFLVDLGILEFPVFLVDLDFLDRKNLENLVNWVSLTGNWVFG